MGKVLKQWLGVGETYLQRATAVGVDDSLALSSEQVRYPGSEFRSKTLGIPIHELVRVDSSVK